jgi:protein pelota
VRLLHQDPSSGLLKLRLETPSDLWRIARLIHPGERVGASTTRRDPEAPEEVPGAHRDRRRVWLVIRAEQVEFHGFSKHVRVTGPIVEGPFDLGRHHTLDLAEGEELTVQKEQLNGADRALLEEGLASRGDPTVLIAAVDWGDSSLVRLRGRSVEPIADLRRTIAGKRYPGGQGEKDRTAYVAEVVEVLRRELPGAKSVIVAGPGFLKEQIAERLSEIEPSVRKILKVVPTAESGRVGVDELLRSGKASQALLGSVAAEEADLVEQLIERLGGGVRAAVGIAEVREASEQGAVETLLVSETLLADAAVTEILDRARTQRARVLIVRSEGESGRRLASLGGTGALLRFDWTPSAGRRVTGSPGPPRAAPRSDA